MRAYFYYRKQVIMSLTITEKFDIIYIYLRDYCKTASESIPFVYNNEYPLVPLMPLCTNPMKKHLIFPKTIEKPVFKAAK